MSTPAKVKSGFNFQTNDFYLHEYQEMAWEAIHDASVREIALLAGIQGGKTSFGALATVKKIGMISQMYPGANFIIGADTYKTLSQATIPTFLKFSGKIGKYNQGRQDIELKWGGKCYLRTSTDPYSVEGIQDCAFAWIDEAGKCSKLFQINVLGRVARLKGQVLYTSTPYALNWLYTDVEKPYLAGERKDVRLIRFSSADNPSFPRDEFERQRQLLDPRMFRMKYMGIHERMQGLVYEIGEDNMVDPNVPMKNVRFFASVDWGFTEGHEFAVLIRAITLDGFRYEVDEFKSAGLDPNQQIDFCKSKMKTYGIECFFCDPSRPDMIAALNKAGIPARGFHVGNESYKTLIAGITEHTGLIRSGRYKIFRGKLPHLMDEYETYHWHEFEEEKAPKDVPVKINDHLMDCARMLTVGTMHVKVKADPIMPMTRVRPKIDSFDPTKRSKQSKRWDTY